VTLVVDASMVVAGLTNSGADGRWAEALLADDSLAAPHLMPAEAGNILRRAALAGDISVDVASLAHTGLLDLRVEFFPYPAVRWAGMGAPGERDLL
jgi:predicted nucleic acid-binding protein